MLTKQLLCVIPLSYLSNKIKLVIKCGDICLETTEVIGIACVSKRVLYLG